MSGNGNGDPISGNDLRLEGKDFAAVGIHKRLHPLNVVEIAEIGVLGVYTENVVAERLDAREVFKTSACRIEERFVNPEVVGIAVNVGHRFTESDHLVAQRGQKGLEPVGSTPAEFRLFVQAEIRKYSEMVHTAGIQPE